MLVVRRQGVTYADSFTRANVSPLGNGWTVGNGTTQPAISSNAATCTTTTAAYYPALYPQQARTDRYYVQVLLGSSPTATAAAVLIRCNTTFTQQVGAFVNNGSPSSAILYIQTATASTATTEASNTTTWASGQYLTLTAAANVYTMWKSSTPAWQSSGTNVLSWTDSSNVASTGLGFRGGGIAVQYASSVASVPLQNFVISDY